MSGDIHIVIVTHNSEQEIATCIEHLSLQSRNISSIILVDSGSDDTSYLHSLDSKWPLQVIQQENIGFAKANNLGFSLIRSAKDSHVIFLNPDCFLPPEFIEKYFEIAQKARVNTCISGKLLGFDLGSMEPTGNLDSTGIYRKWYGKWYDRGQGEKDIGQFDVPQEPLALCGALLCFRIKDLLSLKEQIFDEDFFLYKEDVELGLRLKKKGWTIQYNPLLYAYHCRGWQTIRSNVALELRLMAAKNEILLYKKHHSPYVCWAVLKYIVVLLLRC